MDDNEEKLHKLDHKTHGLSGLTRTEPKPREQDEFAQPMECYAVVFFPQYELGFNATIGMLDTLYTLSHSPEVARMKFTDRIGSRKKDEPQTHEEKWNDYYKAGHRVRKVKIVDLGDA